MMVDESAARGRSEETYARDLEEMIRGAIELCRRLAALHAGAMERLASDRSETVDRTTVQLHRHFVALLGPLAAAARASLPGFEELGAELHRSE